MSKVQRAGLRRRPAALALVASVLVFAAACVPPPTGGGSNSTSSWSVDPGVVDPSTTPDTLNPNLLYSPTAGSRGALAVLLHGTGAGTTGYNELVSTLRSDGYHVIVLRYSAALSTQGACPDGDAGTFPDCHRVFRSETTFGAGVTDPQLQSYDHPVANISAANSVMNRLLKLVDYATALAPGAGWAQFQDATGGSCDDFNATYGACELEWSKVAVLGHSQGAGVALYMAKFLPLRAAGLLSGSYDAFQTGPGSASAAPWTAEPFATPPSDIRTLRHVADGGTARILAVADAVGVPGPEVAAESAPFAGNRLLATTDSTCFWDSVPGHNSTALDLCTPDGAYTAAWRELAGS